MDRQKEERTLVNMLLVVMLHFYCAGENQSSTMTLEFLIILLDLQHQFYIFISLCTSLVQKKTVHVTKQHNTTHTSVHPQLHTQGVPGGMCQTSGECSLC